MSSLFEHFEIPEVDANRQVSDCHIEEISNTFCEKWRSLPPYLEMETIVAKDIDRDHPGCDECEKRCSFLKKWKKMRGMKATYKSLIKALLDTKCREEAEGVCRLLKKADVPAQSDETTKPLLVPLCPTCQKTPDTEGMRTLIKLMSIFYHMHGCMCIACMYTTTICNGPSSAHFNCNNDRGRYNRAGVRSSKKWTSTAQVH